MPAPCCGDCAGLLPVPVCRGGMASPCLPGIEAGAWGNDGLITGPWERGDHPCQAGLPPRVGVVSEASVAGDGRGESFEAAARRGDEDPCRI